MKDTSKEVESRFIEMLMKKSGQERMQFGFSLFEMARKQIIASAKMKNPDADNREIRKLIFLRFYGHEFSLEEQEKILNRIEKYQLPL